MIDWVSVEDDGLSEGVLKGDLVLVRTADADVLLARFKQGDFLSWKTGHAIGDDPVTHYSEINQPED